jgi:hypothetical protein
MFFFFYFNSNRVCGLLVNTLDFKKPYKKKKSGDVKSGERCDQAISHCAKSYNLEIFF